MTERKVENGMDNDISHAVEERLIGIEQRLTILEHGNIGISGEPKEEDTSIDEIITPKKASK